MNKTTEIKLTKLVKGTAYTYALAISQALFQLATVWCLAMLVYGLVTSSLVNQEVFLWLSLWLFCMVTKKFINQAYQNIYRNTANKLQHKWRFSLLVEMIQKTKSHQSSATFAGHYVEDIENLLRYVVQYLPASTFNLVSFTVACILLLFFNYFISLALVVFLILLLVFVIFIGKQVKSTQVKHANSLGYLNNYFLTILQGLYLIRYYGAEKQFDEVISSSGKAFQRTTMKLLYLAFISAGAMEFLQGALIGVSVLMVAVDGFDSVLSLFAILLVIETLQPMRILLESFHIKSAANNALKRLNESYPNWLNNKSLEPTPKPEWQEISLNSLNCFYGKKEVISDVNWQIKKGEYWHIKGESGIGKTTILHSLAGLHGDYSGSIDLHNTGKKTTANSEQLQSVCALVEQKPHLLQGTIKDNLLLADPKASIDDMLEVFKQLDLIEWLKTLPSGLNSSISSGSTNVSGGQAKRISLARALLSKPDILLLDEYSASLDSVTHSKLQKFLQALHASGMTIIEISHQESLEGEQVRSLEITKDGINIDQ